MRRLALVLPLMMACAHPPVAEAPLEASAAAKGATSKPGPVRYALPTCPLSYEVLFREKSFMDGKPQFDTERFMDLIATSEGARMQLAGSVVGRPINNGHRGYGKPTTDYAPPLLETDGRSWTEREGPTWLFSSVGGDGGLAWFFPTLPTSDEPAATAVWNVPFESGQTTASMRTEATRGGSAIIRMRWAKEKNEPERTYPTIFTHADVRVEETHFEAGVRVLSLSLTAVRSDTSADVPDMVITRTYRATYAIAASGRVLRAHVESERILKTPSQTLLDTFDGTMHLVRACDGPVAPSIAPILTAEEKAEPVDDRMRIVLPPP